MSDVRYLPPPRLRSRRRVGGLVALLVAGEPVAASDLGDALVGPLDALYEAGLVASDAGLLRARVAVTPFRGALVVSDRLDAVGVDAVLAPDLSAWNVSASLPPGPSRLFDVGCGAGAIALSAALRGAVVVGTDVDRRALRFARLGACLCGVTLELVPGDLFADVADRFDAVAFNAPLLRSPLLGDGEVPRYLHVPDGEALVVRFLSGARARTTACGEALLHAQLSPAVEAALAESGFAATLSLHFADAVDGTPHALISLRGGAGRHGRLRVPLGPALPHLGREQVDRLHATLALVAEGEAALRAAVLRPPPWLELTRSSVHDGVRFRARAVRFGPALVDDEELALLEACDGRPLGEVLDSASWPLERVRGLLERGLLVV
jgi:SAM-dependent methyltransferase